MSDSSPRANLLRTLRRQGFDQVPVDPAPFCPSQVEAFTRRFGHADYMEYFKAPYRGCGLAMRPGWTDAAALYPRERLPADTRVDDWGVAHSKQADCFHMTHMHHPLQGEVALDEVKNYPLPRFAPDALDQLRAAVAAHHGRGLAARGSLGSAIWEIAWYIRAMEDLMADMMTDDERAHAHFDRLTEHAVERSRMLARGGVDIIHTGDDIGMQKSIMMSLDLWRRWIKPRFARIIAAAREVKPDVLFFYHSCGYVIPFIPELIEIGVDILNPVQPECMEFEEVHRLADGKLSFWGTIGTQTTLPFGTPEQVKADVSARLKVCGAAGGIVIGPTHMVEPEVPWENLTAMADAAAEFRI